MKHPGSATSFGTGKPLSTIDRLVDKLLPATCTIFVRVYETRMDLLRAVLIGPGGTPYHDGLFVFDVHFPPTYPDTPPMVYYYSGGLRLNPNLYDCGKVCLSLLNTWTGKGNEKWMPKKSTMLQVLVSIQALILNAKPFFNEPGYDDRYPGAEGESNSKAYNEEVFILSLKTMMYTLRRPPKHFEELVGCHFRTRALAILSACRAYMEGVIVGSITDDKIPDEKCGSKSFREAVAKMLNGLISNFSRFGATDCDQFRGSNTTLRNHITHPHCEVIKAQKNQNPEAGQTSMAQDGSVFRYDPDYLHEKFAGLVIQRALPFNHFNHEQTTRVFQNTMQPRYTHVSRFTLKRDAMKLWLAAKQEIIDSFGNINTSVNLTKDVWSAPHGVPGSYMCVIAHWIELGTWQMMKRVISFEEFPSPYTGHALFKMLIKVLTNFNLKEKVMSITLDNARNNTSAMDKLKLKYDPPMRGRFYHSHCVAYIINLVVQAGLGVPAIDAIRESFKTMLEDIFKSSARTRKRYVKICKDAEKPCLRLN
nr:hypothetical protein [Tanacetum cinerariifolium]